MTVDHQAELPDLFATPQGSSSLIPRSKTSQSIKIYPVVYKGSGSALLYLLETRDDLTTLGSVLHDEWYIKPIKRRFWPFGRRHHQAIHIGNVSSKYSSAQTLSCLRNGYPLPVHVVEETTSDKRLTRAFRDPQYPVHWPTSLSSDIQSVESALEDNGVIKVIVISGP